MMRTYSELISIPSFKERFEYLKLDGAVGEDTFGWDRHLNQSFYRSKEWRSLRNEIIVRDYGCDLAHLDHPLYGKIIIHHLNPIAQKDIYERTDILMNPEYLVCVSPDTHNAIHYGDINLIQNDPIDRAPNDTCPWRK